MNSIPFSGLRYLINFHKFCGISYFGASVDKNVNNIYRVTSIAWNLIYIGLTFYSSIQFFTDNIKSFTEIKSNSSKSSIISILNIIGVTGYHVQIFAINILLMIRGNRILELIKAQSFKFIDSESERKIGFRIAFVQFVLLFTFEAIYVVFECIYSTEGFIVSKFFSNLIIYFSSLVTISSIISLIAYQSKIISIQIDKISDNFSPKDLSVIYQFICRINSFVKKFDSLISSVIFMNIFNSIIICIVYLCLTAVEFNNKFPLYVINLTVNLVLIIILCYSCDIIPKRIQNFSEDIQELLLFSKIYSNPVDLNQHLMQIKINFLKQEIGFTAFGLIKINSKTMLSVFALILSYSVVLIQTSTQS